ncbi:MAG: hypothetical protein LBG77_01180 [Dysgonamonadaceae bacterium]|jgi:hypothetical protein|nr:hypothetical protein [Dysgonamonadaceae bacterium]
MLTAQKNLAIPTKNNFAIELNFKPFGENVISFNQLQLKYRLTDDWVARLGLSLETNKLDLPGDDYEPSEQRKYAGNENSTKFGVLPGIEFHFLKKSKISPYVGAEFSFFKHSVKSHYRDYTYEQYYNNVTGNYDICYIPVEIDIDGATRSITFNYIELPYGYSHYPTTEYINRAYTSYGGNLLLGCDFYFMRNLYVGLEAGLGYNYTQYKKVSIEMSNQVHPAIIPSYTDSKLGFYYNSALRLGFWF